MWDSGYKTKDVTDSGLQTYIIALKGSNSTVDLSMVHVSVILKNTAAAPGTWALIQEQTPTGTGTVTFSSLGTYTHLKLIYNARGTQAAAQTAVDMRLNGDTGANYDRQRLGASATSAVITESLGQTEVNQVAMVSAGSATAGMSGSGEISFPDYRGTAFHKRGTNVEMWQAGTSTSDMAVQTTAWGWRSTAAITSIALILQSGNWDTGSKFSLYGIA
jgi:hypothetical protein